jgi:hypothetical protein
MKKLFIALVVLLSTSGLFAEVLFNRKLENREFKIEKVSDFHLLTTFEETDIKGNYISCVVKLLHCDKYDLAELINVLSEEESYFELINGAYKNKSDDIKKTREDVDFHDDKLIEYYFYELDIK